MCVCDLCFVCDDHSYLFSSFFCMFCCVVDTTSAAALAKGGVCVLPFGGIVGERGGDERGGAVCCVFNCKTTSRFISLFDSYT
jgi:hypothetical protein